MPEKTPVSKKVTETPTIIKTPDIESKRLDNRKMVQGIFKFNAVPGGTLKFMFKEFKGDPVMKYSLQDNTLVKIPLGVAKHLNKRGKYKIHKHAINEKGIALKTVGQMKNRFEFHSTEFVDVGEYDKAIISAEYVTK